MSGIRLFLENLKYILRSPDLRSIVIIGPILYGIMIPAIYVQRRVSEVAVGVVDLDQTRLSRQIARMIDATEGAAVRTYYPDIQAGQSALSEHEIHGLIYIPHHFEDRFKKRQGTSAAVAVSSSNLTLAGPIIGATSSVAASVSAASMIGQAQARGIHRSKAEIMAQPLRLDLRPIYNPALNYADATVPGLLFVILQQIVIVGLCFAMAEQKERQINEESKAYRPPSLGASLSFLLATILPYTVINFALSVLYLSGLEPLFGIPVVLANLPAAFLLCLVFGLATASFGFLLSHVFKDRMTVLICLLFYSLPGFFSSGYSWPSHLLSLDIRIFGYLFPITYFGDEIRRIYLGPLGLSSYLHALASLLLFFSICMILNLFLLRRGRQQTLSQA